MRIIYIIYNDWSIEQKLALQPFDILVEEGYDRIEVEENTKNKEALKLIDSWGLRKAVGTIYDKKDFAKSSLFVYVGVWENGYPMPDNNNGYKELTYDLSNYCTVCGVGKLQKAPFRIRKEPKWGSKMMFELNWVYDEIFVRKELYESVFKKMGLEFYPVLLHKKETVIGNTVQLKIPMINTALFLNKQPFEICSACSRKKYSPQIKGFFPGFVKPVPELPIFKSPEYFGSGAEAHNKIFITKALRQQLTALKINPKLYPVDPDVLEQ